MASNTAILSSNSQAACTKSEEKEEFFWGCYPAIAANSSGDLVCVYNHYPMISSNIHYAVGNMTGDIGFQWNSQRHISKGSYPRVAINEDKTVILVFTASGKMKYRIGNITPSCNSISWNNVYDIGEGRFPSIAMSGNSVFLVFQKKNECHWNIGEFDKDTDTISWKSDSDCLVKDAKFPSACMKDNLVAVCYRKPEAYKLLSSNYKLCTIVGELNSEGDVEWGECQEVPNLRGTYPCIAMFEDAVVIAISLKSSSLILRHGILEGSSKTVEWQEYEHSLEGRYPSVHL